MQMNRFGDQEFVEKQMTKGEKQWYLNDRPDGSQNHPDSEW